ncbi:putative protein phosphatase 2C T23F11.1 [Orchesella cincta]|uniref:protein-serine/threonine phosphatase n=1 Tax=Orchesella cincta TaxID=48709 RepID=A0A1D2MP06_ORCCI|nr:putative protein phosphatase 2C T23F11.1 [Orchesella cincta]
MFLKTHKISLLQYSLRSFTYRLPQCVRLKRDYHPPHHSVRLFCSALTQDNSLHPSRSFSLFLLLISQKDRSPKDSPSQFSTAFTLLRSAYFSAVNFYLSARTSGVSRFNIIRSVYNSIVEMQVADRLPSPVTEKLSESFENSLVKVGSSSMQGWRTKMEDAHSIILKPRQDRPAHFFGVYDGHGTELFAQDAAQKLFYDWIIKREDYWKGQVKAAIETVSLKSLCIEAFCLYEKSLKANRQFQDLHGGTTANVVLLRNGQVYCGNLGDSRAVACIKGKPFPLSQDHKPSLPSERERIRKAGGIVTPAGRVQFKGHVGSLGLSRAFGDWKYKRAAKSDDQQMVIANPDVTQYTLTSDWEFVVLACDGIWTSKENKDVISFVRERLQQQVEPQLICEELIMSCLATDSTAPHGCDNMTVIIVCCLHGKCWKDYCDKIAGVTVPVPEAGGPVGSLLGADPDPVDDSGDADLVIETPGWIALTRENDTSDQSEGAAGGSSTQSDAGSTQVEPTPDSHENSGTEAHQTAGWSWYIPWHSKPAGDKGNQK